MCSHYLILTSNSFSQDLLLDVDRGVSQLRFAGHDVLQGVQRMQQADRKRRTGAQPGTGRQISVVMDFKTVRDVEVLEDSAYGRVFDLRIGLGLLDAGIGNARAMLEERRQITATDIAVFIDRGGQDRSAVLVKPYGIVRASAEE
jgi:hypothetical protein